MADTDELLTSPRRPVNPSYDTNSSTEARCNESAEEVRLEPRLLDRYLLILTVLTIYNLRQHLMWLLYPLVFVGLLVERNCVLLLLRASPPLLLLLLLAGFSILWSFAPTVTAVSCYELFGTSAIALYFVCRLGLKRFIETLAIAIALAAVLSLLLIVFVPSEAAEGSRGVRGIFGFKNQLGLNMTLGMLTIACATTGFRGIRRALMIAAFILCLLLLIASNSITPAAVAMMLVPIFALLLWSRAKRPGARSLLTILALSTAVLSSLLPFGDEAFAFLGRDSTLTGRTDIWDLVINAISEQPVLGYGFGAFWSEEGPWGQYVAPAVNWVPGAAHNGFLEVMLNFGFVGEAFLIVFLAFGLWRTTVTFWRGRDLWSAWPLCVMLNAVLTNYAEATFLTSRIDWMAITAAFLFATEACRRRSSFVLPDKQGSPAVLNRPTPSTPRL